MSARALIAIPAGAVAGGAILATIHGLHDVALAAHVEDPITWLYPVITDGLAVVAYAAAHYVPDHKRYSWSVVLLASVVSGLAQAVYLAGGTHDAPAWLRFTIGAWPAMAVLLVGHLLYLLWQAWKASDAAGQDVDEFAGVAVVSDVQQRTCVYRLVDVTGQLLYVGCTGNLTKRLQVHRASRSWWPDVAEILVDWYPTRGRALATEKVAIATESPRYNIISGSLSDQAGGPDAEAAAEIAAQEATSRPKAVTRGRLRAVEATRAAERVAQLAEDPQVRDRVRGIAAQGRGRATVMKEFDLSEYQARQLLDAVQGKGDDREPVNA